MTDDAAIAEQARSLRNLCFQPGAGSFMRGWDSTSASPISKPPSALPRSSGSTRSSPASAGWAHEYTRGLRGSSRSAIAGGGALGAKCLLDVRRRSQREDAEWMPCSLRQELRERGVETRPFFLGMHEQPVFHRRGLFLNERYPVAESLARQGLYLPSGLALTEEQLTRVCDAVREVSHDEHFWFDVCRRVQPAVQRQRLRGRMRCRSKNSSGAMPRRPVSQHARPGLRNRATTCSLCPTAATTWSGSTGRKSMLALARKRLADNGDTARSAFSRAISGASISGGKFDAALMMFAVLGYQVENDDVLAALRTARRHLEPGGLFIFDVWYGPAVLHQRPSERVKIIPGRDG